MNLIILWKLTARARPQRARNITLLPYTALDLKNANNAELMTSLLLMVCYHSCEDFIQSILVIFVLYSEFCWARNSAEESITQTYSCGWSHQNIY
jgi:hypothetical protein